MVAISTRVLAAKFLSVSDCRRDGIKDTKMAVSNRDTQSRLTAHQITC